MEKEDAQDVFQNKPVGGGMWVGERGNKVGHELVEVLSG